LRTLENQEFEEAAIVVHRHAPFAIVIGDVGRAAVGPGTAVDLHAVVAYRAEIADYRQIARAVQRGAPEMRRACPRTWQNQRVIPWLGPRTPFPSLDAALDEPNGLLAASPDLTAARLVEAYRQGIFPWYSDDQPVLWWSPDPRMVLYTDELRVTRSLRRVVRQQRFEMRADSAFRAVMEACAATPRAGQSGTWITPAIVDAYCELHDAGFAHSVEAWHEGRLVGGLYGVALGRMFFGESMFALRADASKVALVHLVGLLRARGVPMIDCQQETAHLASFGARPIPRLAFAERLAGLVNCAAPEGAWTPLPASNVLA
jgi:leucyl/phenylalanyl-tRNA--protein transferase